MDSRFRGNDTIMSLLRSLCLRKQVAGVHKEIASLRSQWQGYGSPSYFDIISPAVHQHALEQPYRSDAARHGQVYDPTANLQRFEVTLAGVTEKRHLNSATADEERNR